PSDWLIEIFDGRFVGIRHDGTAKATVIIFGDLRQQATRFAAWLPLPRRGQFAGGGIAQIAQERRGDDSLIKAVAEREDPSLWAKKTMKELHQAGYQLEHHEGKTDLLCIAAEFAVRSPVFKSTINISFAIRKALRRYLGLEPIFQDLNPENQYEA